MTRLARPLRWAAALGVVTLGLAACSSTGGKNTSTTTTGKSYTIAMITHETPGDTFWSKVRNGAQAAAKALNVTLKYSNDPDQAKMATLVQNAIDSKVNGIAVTLAYPDAVGPVAQKAIQAGIPVVAFNQGISDYQRYGISMYFGSDEQLAGRTVGERLAKNGTSGTTLCIIQDQGSVALTTRCAGVKAAYPNTQVLYVNGADDASVQQTITAKLQQDPGIKNIVTLGAPIALDALKAKAAANSTATIATFDLNQTVAQDIQNGTIAFSVDQQPYVQGYMAVTALWLNLTNGNDIGGGKPVLTGPSMVDKSNIGKIVQYTKNNTR